MYVCMYVKYDVELEFKLIYYLYTYSTYIHMCIYTYIHMYTYIYIIYPFWGLLFAVLKPTAEPYLSGLDMWWVSVYSACGQIHGDCEL